MRKKHICPNCGAKIVLPSIADNLVCQQCNSPLLLKSGSKLFLANPSSSFLDEDRTPHKSEPATQDDYPGPLELSESRQKSAAMLAHERRSQEKKRRQEGIFSGRLAITMGLLLLGVLGIQIYFLGVNEFNIVGTCVGLFLVIVEIFIVIWFRRSFRSDE